METRYDERLDIEEWRHIYQRYVYKVVKDTRK